MFFQETVEAPRDTSPPLKNKEKISLRESGRLRERQKIDYSSFMDEDDLLEEEQLNRMVSDYKEDEGTMLHCILFIQFTAAAINAELHPYDLSPFERIYLPQFVNNPGTYFQVRNHILKKWQANVNKYLTVQQAAKAIQVSFTSAQTLTLCPAKI